MSTYSHNGLSTTIKQTNSRTNGRKSDRPALPSSQPRSPLGRDFRLLYRPAWRGNRAGTAGIRRSPLVGKDVPVQLALSLDSLVDFLICTGPTRFVDWFAIATSFSFRYSNALIMFRQKSGILMVCYFNCDPLLFLPQYCTVHYFSKIKSR
jgi:hypothetical protein